MSKSFTSRSSYVVSSALVEEGLVAVFGSTVFSRLLRSCQNSQLWTKGYIFRRRVERAATIALPLAGEFVAAASALVMEGRLFVRREDGCAMVG